MIYPIIGLDEHTLARWQNALADDVATAARFGRGGASTQDLARHPRLDRPQPLQAATTRGRDRVAVEPSVAVNHRSSLRAKVTRDDRRATAALLF